MQLATALTPAHRLLPRLVVVVRVVVVGQHRGRLRGSRVSDRHSRGDAHLRSGRVIRRGLVQFVFEIYQLLVDPSAGPADRIARTEAGITRLRTFVISHDSFAHKTTTRLRTHNLNT